MLHLPRGSGSLDRQETAPHKGCTGFRSSVSKPPSHMLVAWGAETRGPQAFLVLRRERGNDPSKPSNWWFPLRRPLGSFPHSPSHRSQDQRLENPLLESTRSLARLRLVVGAQRQEGHSRQPQHEETIPAAAKANAGGGVPQKAESQDGLKVSIRVVSEKPSKTRGLSFWLRELYAFKGYPQKYISIPAPASPPSRPRAMYDGVCP